MLMEEAKPMSKKETFKSIFYRLRDILINYEAVLVLKANTESNYSLDTCKMHPSNKKQIFFGAAQINKNYVSYHLMPIYGCPDLNQQVSEELRKRMQGKSCFNFKVEDEDLFKQLESLTAQGYAKFKDLNWA
jgi:hypothetical protein